jgi:hypothetical protein
MACSACERRRQKIRELKEKAKQALRLKSKPIPKEPVEPNKPA